MRGQGEESLSLRLLYKTPIGRIILKPLISPVVSELCGMYLDSPSSRKLIPRFIEKNGIDMSEYQCEEYTCFNDFFTRKIKPESRPIPTDPAAFIAPCDGLLSAYKIKYDTVIPAKQSFYTLDSLLHDNVIAEKYIGGYCLVFRLCVNHYHRYCYLDSGYKGENIFISGKLHTVRPIALESSPVFAENSREYTVLHTENFGDVTQVEVGALLVGKIKNHSGSTVFKRGQEKGMFLYGGSTVILLVEEGKVRIKEKYLKSTCHGKEFPIKQGQIIGTAVRGENRRGTV